MGLSKEQNIISYAFWLLLVFVCIVLYSDYGISWDENTQRDLGIAAYNYVQHGNLGYLQMLDRFYGVGIDLPLIYLEKLFNLKDYRDIILFRHFVNFSLFSFALFLFFRMNLKLFKKTIVAIVPTLMLLLTPRIFGHAFFNPKDVPFLSMYIISFYFLYRYILKPGIWRLLALAIVTAILINFRIMGVLFLITSLAIILIKLISTTRLKFGLHVLLYIAISALVLYATWPFLWNHPVKNFRDAFLTMSKFPYNSDMLFRGHIIKPGTHLFDYLFTWIGISVPFLYLITGLAGISAFIIKALKSPSRIIMDSDMMIACAMLITLLAPVAAVFYFHSTLYDDWRQLYFIYPFFIVFSGFIVQYLLNSKKRLAKIGLNGLGVYIVWIGIQMIQMHPYENIYFNELASKQKNHLQKSFDYDYWGTSYYAGLMFLARYDSSDNIRVWNRHYPVIMNHKMLPKKVRARTNINYGIDEADYYLTTLRTDPEDTMGNQNFKEVIFEIKRQNSVILRVWKK